MTPTTIALDGPAASGKSTVASILADELGYVYFDTGVMYRAVAWAALDRGIDVEDDPSVAALAESLRIEVRAPSVDDGRQYDVLADGIDVTWAIRSPEVTVAVSPVSANPGVRVALTEQQRRIAADNDVVMAGRDIGTVVVPDAPLKVYLDASPQERARRRYQQMVDQGRAADYDAVLADVLRRDAYDSNRQAAPLRPADDAIVIDSTELAVDQVLTMLRTLVAERIAGSTC